MLLYDTLVNICLILGFYANGQPDENEFGPDYGTEWLMYLDDNGSSHILNFSTLPQRGLIFGEAYFNLYTRKNDIGETIEIPENDDSVINSKYYNSSNDLKVLTHGWLSSDEAPWLQNIKNFLLQTADVNVINVDWSELSDNLIYPWPALSTRYVGKRIAKLLIALRKAYQVEGENVHLIGHSLGAHVMGYAGMFYDKEVRRITGLDPARPLFELPRMGRDFRLDKTDANFVDIIHTCGGVLGYLHSHGHADFYPNSGRPKQPGCEGTQQVREGCSHGRSCEFFVESIYSGVGFQAYPCESWEKYQRDECTYNSTLMGYPASLERQGDFYLHTNAEPDYAIA